MSINQWWDSVRRAAVESVLRLASHRARALRPPIAHRPAERLEARVMLSATHLVYAQPPAGGVTGTALNTITVDVEDATNSIVTTDASTVTLTLSAGAFSTGSATTSKAAVAGVAMFTNLVITSAGTFTVTATDGTLTSTNATTSIYALDDTYFASPPDGATPNGNVVFDSSGDLFGTTVAGGPLNDGLVYEIPAGGTSLTVLATFNGTNGANPAAGLTLDSSGDLFGTAPHDTNNDGVVFEIVHGATTVTDLASFNNTNGAVPNGGVIFDTSGDLFGTTMQGGSSTDGVVYEILHGTATITDIASFNGTNGANPYDALILDTSGNLYGTTYFGGINSDGALFEIPKSATTINTLASFNGTNGENPVTGLLLDTAGDLYGTTDSGGGGSNVGVVFELAAASMSIAVIAPLNDSIGEDSHSTLVFDSSGDLLGTTALGGADNFGVVFKVVPGATTITTLATFNGITGDAPDSGITLNSVGNLFGTTSGNTGHDGSVFEIPAGSTSLITLALFGDPSGASPQAGLTRDSQGDFFGTTEYGGTDDVGTVFEVPRGTSIPITLDSFNWTNGALPRAALTFDSRGDLFGTTSEGGTAGGLLGYEGYGTIFEIPAGATTLTTILSFNHANGADPLSNLVMDSSGDFFGTTDAGGAQNVGTVFKIPAGATTIISLASFTESSVYDPQSSIAIDSSGDIFGVAVAGGAGSDGAVFELLKGSSTVTTVASFNGTNGNAGLNSGYFDGGVILDSSGDLFGATPQGGASDDGTVFEIPAAATTVQTLVSFNGVNAGVPSAPVTLDTSGDLFGTTTQPQTLFEIPYATTSLVILMKFNGTDGEDPRGPLTLDSNGDIFGATEGAGANTIEYGNIFELAVAPSSLIFTAPPLSMSAGATINGTIGVQAALDDAFGNGMPVPPTSVILTLTGGTFSAGTTTTAAMLVNGVATFNSLVINNPGSDTLTASAGALVSAASSFGVYLLNNIVSGLPRMDTNLVVDTSGNVFGTTDDGVSSGTVFELAQGSTTITTLATLDSPPGDALLLDSSGDLFGTVSHAADGTIFEIPHGSTSLVTLVSFNGTNGSDPETLVMDTSGNLFGTAEYGGVNNLGAVFEIAKGSTTVTLLASCSSTNNPNPFGGVAVDSSGDVYGTSSAALFEVVKGSSMVATIATLTESSGVPSLTMDSGGNLYGTCSGGGPGGDGIVFELARGSTTITTIASFNSANGLFPTGILVDTSGNVFGTTGNDSYSGGTVFEIAHGSTTIATINSFNNLGDGAVIRDTGLALDSSGNIYGENEGQLDETFSVTLFELSPSPLALAFTTPPSSTTGGSTIDSPAGVQVGVNYPWGNLDAAAPASTVTLTLNGGTFAGGSATATVSATDGVATFSSLVINTGGSYTLTATDASVTEAISPAFIVAVAPTISSVVVNGNNSALVGTQASMVNSIVYTFNEAVNIGANAFSMVLDANFNSGTVPTLSWAALSGTGNTQWVVTFSGAGVTPGGSIGDGVYDITLSASSVTAVAGGLALASNRTDVFYRLFGDAQGTGKVNASDYLLFASTFGLKSNAAGFLAEFDDEGSGKISSQDYILFANNFGTGFKNVTNITTIETAAAPALSLSNGPNGSKGSFMENTLFGKITVPVSPNSQVVSSPGISLAVPATAVSASALNSSAATNTPGTVSVNVSTDGDGGADAREHSDRIDDIVAIKQSGKPKATGKPLIGYHLSPGQSRPARRLE